MSTRAFLYRYRLWCQTDQKFEYYWGTSLEPDECPRDSGHSIDTKKISVIQEIPAIEIDHNDSPYQYKKRALIVNTEENDVIVNLKVAQRVNWPIIIVKTSLNGSLTISDAPSQINAQESYQLGPGLPMGENSLVFESNGVDSWVVGPSYLFRERLDETEISNLSTTLSGEQKGDLLVDDGEELTYLECGQEGQFLQIYNLSETGLRWTSLESLALTLTNKTLDANENTLINLNDSNLAENAHINLNKIGTGTVLLEEFNHLSGVSSNLQSQLNVLEAFSQRTDNPHLVTKAQVGLSFLTNLKSNFNATNDPSVNNDSSEDYSVGSRWLNLVEMKEWICINPSVGAAVWSEISNHLISLENLGSSPAIGIFAGISSKVGQFKSLVSTNNLLTLTDNTGQGTIDFTVNEGNIEINNLSGQLDLSSLGSVNLTNPQEGDLLRYNATLSAWENVTSESVVGGGSGPQSTTQTAGFDAYYNAGGENDDSDMSDDEITFSFTEVPLSIERFKTTSSFTHLSGSAEVTVNNSGNYYLTARCTTYVSKTGNRTTTFMRLMIRSTSGSWSVIPGSLAAMYNRMQGEGYDTGNVTLLISLESGDRLKMEVAKLSGNGEIRIMSEGCSLTILKV